MHRRQDGDMLDMLALIVIILWIMIVVPILFGGKV
jgi:hypothetical protein